jgi:glucose/arabinose dehydrogenase
MFRKLLYLCALALTAHAQSAPPAQPALVPHTLTYAPGQSITLNLPAPLDIDVAASGLHRVRFLAQAPDGRIFATGMWNLADNTQGAVFILEGWNPQTHRFARVTTFLDHLRNPNNLAFWTDPATHQTWLYLPLTDRLERFPFHPGDEHPAGPPQVLLRFPDYGLNYKYGGWHLTRTVTLGTLHGRTRVYVAAGSSCDFCREREVIRATVTALDPDGSHPELVAQGLRNAVDLRFVPDLDGGALFATNMGDDHLGETLPEDTFFELDSNTHPGPIASAGPGHVPNYGWPTCFFAHGQPTLDTTPLPDMPPPGDLTTEAERPAAAGTASHSRPADAESVYGAQPGMASQGTLLAAGGNGSTPDPNASLGQVPAPLTTCANVPPAYTTFAAHSSPLGLAFFGAANPTLQGSFLVALHGASRPRIGTGYRVVRFTPSDRTPEPFLTGFLTSGPAGKPLVHGRPCGLLRLGPDTFLLTDDKLGLVYFIHPRR